MVKKGFKKSLNTIPFLLQNTLLKEEKKSIIYRTKDEVGDVSALD